MTQQVVSPIDTQSRIEIKIQTGDSVRVWQKIKEKNKIRLQAFEGIVISKKHGNEPGSTFTVRRVGTDGIGIEKTFPLFSPMIDKIEVTRRSKTRKQNFTTYSKNFFQFFSNLSCCLFPKVVKFCSSCF